MVLIFNSTVSREISGTNFTRVRLSGNKIARCEAECYLSLMNTHEIYPEFHSYRAITCTYIDI